MVAGSRVVGAERRVRLAAASPCTVVGPYVCDAAFFVFAEKVVSATERDDAAVGGSVAYIVAVDAGGGLTAPLLVLLICLPFTLISYLPCFAPDPKMRSAILTHLIP
ncbi:hypothetical protein B0H14DRAFT_2742105 [Mycena olivaceomarginata]|nr:hypothetical protein B0H14DRAFT_2742105 [Mycena olivaceomarginata]